MSQLSPSPLRRWGAALAGLASLVLLAGCTVPDPEGAAPLRYREQIFPSIVETPDVQYGQGIGPGKVTQKLYMDIYAPPATDTVKRRPVALWMHGGGFSQGTRKDPMMVELARRFARRGYVSVSISYRLMAGELCGGAESTVRCSSAAVEAAADERDAIRYLHENATRLGIDESRIGIGGASAGGVASVLTSATPTDRGTSGQPSGKVNSVFSISGALPAQIFFSPGEPPVYFWHGTADNVVPYAWARDNSNWMNSHGQISVLHDVEGAGHVPTAQYFEDMDSQARNWYYRVMGLQLAEGSP